MTVILQCPVCRSPLVNSASGFQCSNNHSFDVAREGYVNLLLAHQKHSRQPGDSKEMIQSRTRFLELGLYNPVSDALNQAAAKSLPAERPGGAVTILDAGCGEGFYLERLKKFLEKTRGSAFALDCYGLDISKSGIRRAAKRDRMITWLVAGVRGLPFADSSLDMIVNVFSPIDIPEFSRVLRRDGVLITATPGPKHLKGLREVIYTNPREHAAAAINEEAARYFSPESETRVAFSEELATREAIQDLLAMTPYYWNIDRQTRARVDALERLALDVDVMIRVFRKRGEPGTAPA